MRATLKSAMTVALVFQLLLSAVTTAAVLASPDDSHRCVPQDPERPSLAGQTLEIASEKLCDGQLLPLTCIYRNLALRFENADLVFYRVPGNPRARGRGGRREADTCYGGACA